MIDASLRLRCRQRERFGLRPVIQRMVAQRGARWSSVPFGSPAAVDGPFLEGGDVLLNGRQIYVGMSGCASDMAGIDWLQALLGSDYRVIPVALRSNVLHLDCALALIKPGLLVWCPAKLIDGLPTALRDWDKIEVSIEEATLLATNGLVLEEGRVIIDADNARVIGELKQRGIDVIPLPSTARSASAAACAAPTIRCCARACWRRAVDRALRSGMRAIRDGHDHERHGLARSAA